VRVMRAPQRGQVGRARRLRREATKAERLLWSKLRGQTVEGVKWRRQDPFGKYIADFSCRKAKLVVEVDGWSHDDTAHADQVRDEWMWSQGYQVVRVSNMDVLQRLDETANMLWEIALDRVRELDH